MHIKNNIEIMNYFLRVVRDAIYARKKRLEGFVNDGRPVIVTLEQYDFFSKHAAKIVLLNLQKKLYEIFFNLKKFYVFYLVYIIIFIKVFVLDSKHLKLLCKSYYNCTKELKN